MSCSRFKTTACTETSSAAVGSRIAGERQRDNHALADAARELERTAVVAFARACDPDLLQRLDRPLAAIVFCNLRVLTQHVLDLVEMFMSPASSPLNLSRSIRKRT